MGGCLKVKSGGSLRNKKGWSFLRKRTLAEVAWIGDSHVWVAGEPRTHGGTVRGW